MSEKTKVINVHDRKCYLEKYDCYLKDEQIEGIVKDINMTMKKHLGEFTDICFIREVLKLYLDNFRL